MFMLLFLAHPSPDFGQTIPRIKMLLWEVEFGDEKRSILKVYIPILTFMGDCGVMARRAGP